MDQPSNFLAGFMVAGEQVPLTDPQLMREGCLRSVIRPNDVPAMTQDDRRGSHEIEGFRKALRAGEAELSRHHRCTAEWLAQLGKPALLAGNKRSLSNRTLDR